MKISLLVSTYDRPDALAAVLASAAAQTLPPHEVVIGDDGSGPATAAVVRDYSARLPLTHLWQTHDGFRAARARNVCAAAATGDYLVIIDGDILLHPCFLADHAAAAAPGFFVQGGRALLGEAPSRDALESPAAYWPRLTAAGISNRKNLLRLPVLSRAFAGAVTGLRGIRTCNFAVWREDYEKVNGFNEDFVGWGREDSEFAVRLLNAGVRRRNLRFSALCCHIHHPPVPGALWRGTTGFWNGRLPKSSSAANGAWTSTSPRRSCDYG